MSRFLINIQNKPEGFKKTVMWAGIFLIMAVIFGFWIFTFPSPANQTLPADEATENLRNNLPSAIESLKFQFKELLKLIK